MRKIEQQMLAALRDGRDFRSGNTAVSFQHGTATVTLYGNIIATIYPDHALYTLAGWPTVTTRSRLNALLRGTPHSFCQRNYTTYFNGVDATDQIIKVTHNDWCLISAHIFTWSSLSA